MLPVKSIFLVGLYVSFVAYGPTPSGATHPERIKWIVEKTSTLSIAGSTNINKFCCQVTEYTGPDTLMTVKEAGGVKETGISLQGLLRIDIKDFDCRNRIMTSEFKHTLKYQQYPQLIISFLSLEKLPTGAPENGSVKGWVEVGLAGVSRKFEICYTSCRLGDGDLELIGVRAFGFSDFSLTAPRKMGGLVRVNDQLDVQFRLRLHQIN
ncbi:MAG TPA: hypothetical protein VHD83_25680 [Puia sp.]|nr:hypothetical protein [Puia sp.]